MVDGDEHAECKATPQLVTELDQEVSRAMTFVSNKISMNNSNITKKLGRDGISKTQMLGIDNSSAMLLILCEILIYMQAHINTQSITGHDIQVYATRRSPYSMGDMHQEPQRMPETMDSAEALFPFSLSLYTHTHPYGKVQCID